jgi:hypothetical protein
VTLNTPYKIDLYDNVYVTGIDGDTGRLITSRNGGYLIDYPKLTTVDLSNLMEIMEKKLYYVEELSRRQVWFNEKLHKRFATIEEAGKETVSISGAVKLLSDLMSPEENKRN